MASPDLQLDGPDPRMTRKTVRQRITLVHNQVMANYYNQSTLPSPKELDQWLKELRALDAIIKDGGSETYVAKVIQILDRIKAHRNYLRDMELVSSQSDGSSVNMTVSEPSIRDIGSQLSFQSLSVSSRTPPVGTPLSLPSWNHVQPPIAGPQPMNHFPVQSADVGNPYLPHQQWPGQYTSAYQQPHQQWTGPPRQQPHYHQQSAFPVVGQPQVHPMHSFNQQWYLQPPMPAHQFPQYTGGQQFIPQPVMLPNYPWNGASMTVPMTIVQKEVELIPFDGVPGHYQQFERLFDAVYGTNPAYTDSQKFLLFHKYVGAAGRPFLESIDPIDPMGLVYAKGQMRQHFNDPFRVRAQVKAKIDALPVTKSARQTAVLEKNLVVCEGALRDLIHSGATEEFINQVLYEHIAAKLPWQLVNSYGKSNFIKTVTGLLQHARCDLQNAKETNARTGNLDTDNPPQSKAKKTLIGTLTAEKPSNSAAGESKCAICDEEHRSINCNSFDAKERKQRAIQRRLCFRCLRPGHNVASCKSAYKCRQCGHEHSLVICSTENLPSSNKPSTSTSNPKNKEKKQEETKPKETSNKKEEENPLVATSTSSSETQYYQTVLVSINGKKVRIMLDSGGGVSTILSDLATELQLPTVGQQKLYVGSAFHAGKTMSSSRVKASVFAIDSDTSIEVELNVVESDLALKLPVVPPAVRTKLSKSGFSICDIDDSELDQYPVKIILGVKYYSSLWLGPEQQIGKYFAVRQSIFGWVAIGVLFRENQEEDVSYNLTSTIVEESLKLENTKPPSPTEHDRRIELEYLDNFVDQNVLITETGYSVRLNWKDKNRVNLDTNRTVAKNRFRRLLESLRSRNLLEAYTQAMAETVNRFAERAPAEDTPGRTYLLPHHAVIRPDKSTSQVRVVYDASSHAGGSKSLNDHLFKGVTFWDSTELLNKFRFGSTVLIADIAKAFLMIGVEPEDRDALRFLWLDENQKPVEYRFKVVPFGTTASPFLLFAVMHFHFRRYREQFSDVVPLIKDNFYVDDLLLALPNLPEEKLECIKERTVNLFRLGGMDLRKWRTNVAILDAKWAPGEPAVTKVLGYKLDLPADVFSVAYQLDPKIVDTSVNLTKRRYSSFLSSVYDPNGLISPFVIYLRLLFRKIWQTTEGWDDPLPDDLQIEAKAAMKEAVHIPKLNIPRNVLATEQKAELIIFCDASLKALGAVAYVRTAASTVLFTSKSKLARMGETRMPYLELDALMMAAKMAKRLGQLYAFDRVTIFSDNLINLHRLSKEPNEMKAAIAIRIMKLRNITSAVYMHVSTKANIADIVSRGCTMTELLDTPTWINGPTIADHTLLREEVVVNLHTADQPSTECQCKEYRSYNQALQIFRNSALQKLFLKGTKNENLKSLHREDLALVLLLKLLQRSHFESEITEVEQYGAVKNPHSILHNFDCFLDTNGLLRIRTRLAKALKFSYDVAHPIVLHNHCRITRLIVEREHRRTYHAGVDRTIEAIRDRFYIPHAKHLVKSVKSKCYYCIRVKAVASDPSFGPLPEFRLDEGTPPFTNVGLDILGPLHVSMTIPGPRYVLIFTCATTRNIHLEVLSSMTEKEVFSALRSFISRFGIPHVIYSDNGTQLVAVKKKLRRFLEGVAKAEGVECRLVWHLQAVTAPWRGGFFERLIRTVKDALRAVTFRRVIDDRELRTTLMEVECRMNSRPLFSYDGVVITPSHFLLGHKLDQLPAVGNKLGSTVNRGDSIIDHYIKSQRTRNAIWAAWHASYMLQLASFHHNPKKKGQVLSLKADDVVLLKNHQDKLHWPLAIIEKVYTGADGVTRSADVRTTVRGKPVSKLYAVQNIVPLECHQAEGPLVGDDPAVLATLIAKVITSDIFAPGSVASLSDT